MVVIVTGRDHYLRHNVWGSTFCELGARRAGDRGSRLWVL